MPNLNLDLNFFDHPKTKRLVGLLGRGSEVLPIKLWAYAGKVRAEDGRLIGHAAQEIESIAGWWGKPGEMLEVMLREGTRFLEQEADGTYILHDWLEYQGHLAAYKIRAKKAAAARWNKLAGQEVIDNATSIPKGCLKQSPILTKPAKPTKPTKPTKPKDDGDLPYAFDADEIPESLKTLDFIELWPEWVAQRSKKRGGLNRRSARWQLQDCAEWGPEKAIRALRDAIGGNWQGLHEPRGSNGISRNTGQAAPTKPAEAIPDAASTRRGKPHGRGVQEHDGHGSQDRPAAAG